MHRFDRVDIDAISHDVRDRINQVAKATNKDPFRPCTVAEAKAICVSQEIRTHDLKSTKSQDAGFLWICGANWFVFLNPLATPRSQRDFLLLSVAKKLVLQLYPESAPSVGDDVAARLQQMLNLEFELSGASSQLVF